MLQRYGNPSNKHRGSPQATQLAAFARTFQDAYSSRCLVSCLRITELRPNGRHCPDRLLTLALNYIEDAIEYKGTYATLRPQLEPLLGAVVFPLLCFNERDSALWQEDATEYVRKEFDVMEDYYSPRSSATNLLLSFVRKRRKDCLHFFVSFCAQVLQEEPPPSPPSAQAACYYRKDGALLALGSMHAILSKPGGQYRASLEPMLVTHVLPMLESPYGFLRLRAVWIYGQFARSLYSRKAGGGAGDGGADGGASAPSLANVFPAMLARMADPELPVRVQAALAINHLVESDCCNECVLRVLPELVRALFALMADIGNDEVIQALDTLIDKFGDQMSPYAVEIVRALVGHFLKIFEESQDDDGEMDDSALAAMGMMQAISTMMQAVHTQPHMYAQMEESLLPLLQRAMQEGEPHCTHSFEPYCTLLFEPYCTHSFEPHCTLLFSPSATRSLCLSIAAPFCCRTVLSPHPSVTAPSYHRTHLSPHPLVPATFSSLPNEQTPPTFSKRRSKCFRTSPTTRRRFRLPSSISSHSSTLRCSTGRSSTRCTS